MRENVDRRPIRGLAGCVGLLLAAASACFADPGRGGPSDLDPDDESDGSDTASEESTSEHSESESGDPLPDLPGSGEEESGETGEGECLWLRFGENVEDDVAGVTTDTWIDEEFPDVNHGSADALHADGVSAQGMTETSLLRFELSALPAGTVTDAVLWFATNADEASESSPGSQFSVHVVNEPWLEGQADWQQASDAAPWSVVGCMGDPCRGEPELTFFEPTEQSHSYELPLAPAVVEAWRDDPAQNHGFLLATEAANGADFHSSESPVDTMRPALEIRVCLE
jgi:hypothetical protein